MSDERTPADDTGGFRVRLPAFLESLGKLAENFEKLANIIDKQHRRQLVSTALFLLVCGVLLYLGFTIVSRLDRVTEQLAQTTEQLDALRTESGKTQRKVEGVSTQVQAVADEQPSVVLVDAGAGKPAKPSIIVKPKPSPSPGPKAPPVAVPLELPKATIPDAAAP